MMSKKIGLFEQDINDEKLILDLLKLMNKKKYDYTNTFCSLMQKDIKKENLYKDNDFMLWYKRWTDRLKKNNKPIDLSVRKMREVNPLVISLKEAAYLSIYSKILPFVSIDIAIFLSTIVI